MSKLFDLSETEKDHVRLMKLNDFDMDDWQEFSVCAILAYLCDVTGGDKSEVQECLNLFKLDSE